jgi:predicted ATPase/DNA-binding SARP family transcriptional activator
MATNLPPTMKGESSLQADAVTNRASCPLTIRLFGPFEVWMHGAPLPRLRARKGQWLLALLTLHSHVAVERAWLAGTLWPDSPEPQAFNNLRVNLADLRRALGPEAVRLQAPTARTLRLDLSGADADLLAFDQAIASTEIPALERAVALHRGPLLEGCTEPWAFQERQAREQAYLDALETLASHAMATGDHATAERRLRRAAAVDPLRENTQRALMQALAAGGNYAAALQVYRELRLLLHREIHAGPDPETQSTFEQIRTEARLRAERSERRVARHNKRPRGSAASAPTSRSALARPGKRLNRSSPLLSSKGVRPHLPSPLTSFIGRESQIAEILRRLEDHRLLTLTGAGGCGKTRLALRVAGELVGEFAGGVWLVELAPLADPALVPQAVATALGVREEPDRPLVNTLTRALCDRQLLLVLDNCEHLVDACAHLVETLLEACPSLKILATSREPLRITGENPFRVPSLSLPNEAPLPPWERLIEYEAVRLFVERAALVQPGFRVTNKNAAWVTQVCHRLDGIPLAIELAAARASALPVQQIAQRLDDRFHLLTTGSRTALPRHRTLQALIDWSYDLLQPKEQALLRRLSVFAGGWTLEAAEAVCHGDGLMERELLDLLTTLVEKSLVQYEAEAERYRLLETVRQYARDRLLEAGEGEAVRSRHVACFLALAEEAESKMRSPAKQEWLERLDREHDNLRAALAWCHEQTGETERELRLAAALWWFWALRDHVEEGRGWLTGALARSSASARTAARAEALCGAGMLANEQGDAAGRHLLEDSIALRRELENRQGLACSLRTLAGMIIGQDDPTARSLLVESRAICEELGDRWGLVPSLWYLGHLAAMEKDHAGARPLYQEAASVAREVGDQWNLSWALCGLGGVALDQQDLTTAQTWFTECLKIQQGLGTKGSTVYALQGLGTVARERGEYPIARSFFEEALAIWREARNTDATARSLLDLGAVAVHQGDYSAACAFWSESLVLFQELDDPTNIAVTLDNLAQLAQQAQDNPETARALWEEEPALDQERGCHQ